MTFPGAETINAGIIGDDCFRFRAILVVLLFLNFPLSFVLVRLSLRPLRALFGGMDGEVDGLSVESDGVSTSWTDAVVVLELERERELVCLTLRGFPDHLVEVLVIIYTMGIATKTM